MGFPLNSEVYYISTLPVEVDVIEVASVVVCAIVISLLATIYPSIQAARLNGAPLKAPFFSHASLVAGGVLELTMGANPNRRCLVVE